MEMAKFKSGIKDTGIVENDAEQKIVEGRDISVCVRARPLLDFELSAGYFDIVHAQKPTFYLLEPKLNVSLQATLQAQNFDVDYAFGPKDENQVVYNDIVLPMVDLSLKGGICSIFAYGQTGSGKTYTIQGFLTRIADDLFARQSGQQLNEDKSSRL